jgi:hypothetical protein
VLLANYPDVDEDWSSRSERAKQPPGQWMYPRASDLTSKQVQSYSDRELFWIIQNEIRFTGMPAFAKR